MNLPLSAIYIATGRFGSEETELAGAIVNGNGDAVAVPADEESLYNRVTNSTLVQISAKAIRKLLVIAQRKIVSFRFLHSRMILTKAVARKER